MKTQVENFLPPPVKLNKQMSWNCPSSLWCRGCCKSWSSQQRLQVAGSANKVTKVTGCACLGWRHFSLLQAVTTCHENSTCVWHELYLFSRWIAKELKPWCPRLSLWHWPLMCITSGSMDLVLGLACSWAILWICYYELSTVAVAEPTMVDTA
jgi:hypothetical protein